MAKCTGDEDAIRRAAEALTTSEKPPIFDPGNPDNVLIMSEQRFEDTCAALEELGVNSPKLLTEFEFYSRLRYFEKKQKEAKK